jgi:PAS domain S-box-containing protein
MMMKSLEIQFLEEILKISYFFCILSGNRVEMEYLFSKGVLDLLNEAFLIIRSDFSIEYASKKALALFELSYGNYSGHSCYALLEKQKKQCPNCKVKFDARDNVSENIAGNICISRKYNPITRIISGMEGDRLLMILDKTSEFDQKETFKPGKDENIIQYKRLINHLSLPALITDSNNKICFVNARGLRKFGFKLSEVKDKSFKILLPVNAPDDKSTIIFNTGKPELFDNEVITLSSKQNKQMLFSSHVSSIQASEGIFFLWILKDISIDEETHEELRQREQYLRSIFRAAPVGIGVVIDRVFYFVNKRITEITGYSASELLGCSAQMLYCDEEEFLRVGEIKYSEIDKKGTGSLETKWKCKDGSIREILLSSTPIDDSDLKRGVTFTALDITEGKMTEKNYQLSERKYKRLIEDAPDAIFITDADSGEIVDCNPKALELTGFNYNELIGIHQSKLHPEDPKKIVEKEFKKGTKGLKQFSYTEILHKEGRRIPVEINSSYFSEGNGKKLVIGFFRDLTQRFEWQKALSESESKYEIIFESVKEGILFFDPKMRRFQYANPAMCDFLEYTRDELLQLSTENIHPAESFSSIQSEINEVLEGKKNAVIDVPCLTNSGKIVFADVHATYILLQGEAYIAAFFNDSTQRRETEKQLIRMNRELEQANLLFSTIAHNIPDIILRIDPQFRCTYVNQNVIGYAGIESIDFIGKRLTEMNLDPDFTRNREKDFAYVINQKKALQTNLNVKTDKGRRILEWRMIPEMDDTGKVVSVLNLIRDITLVKKTETELNKIFNLSSDLICIASIDGKFIKLNPAFELLLGYSEQELLTVSFFDLLHPDDIKLTRELIKEKLIHNEIIKNFENRFRCKDGTYKWLSWTSQPLGEEDLIFAIAHDVTEQRIAMKELTIAKDRAEESDRLKSAFLANMSHEIRTPMNAIMGFSSLLKREDLIQDKRNHYIEIINNRSEDLLHILDDILDISRIESGQLQIVCEEFAINEMLSELFEVFSQKIKSLSSKSINLRISKKLPKEHDNIISDQLRIKQVISNLIDNAIKFTDSGEIKFGCVMGNGQVQFFVIDTGIGIPRHKQANIFERFRQAEESVTRKYGGNGLGLAICEALVKMMGGIIWVESVEDKGASFYFTIPAEDKDIVKLPKKIKRIGEGMNLEGKKILIVEDEPLSREFLSIILQQVKAEVTFARSGGEALVIYEANPDFDLILMDVQLPDINGYEVTRRIRKQDKHIPIIAQTAFAMSEDYAKCLNAGCTDYLSKPIRSDDLLATIMKVLKGT